MYLEKNSLKNNQRVRIHLGTREVMSRISIINNNIDINLINNNLYCKQIVKPTLEELKLHQNYLKLSLKKNFFN